MGSVFWLPTSTKARLTPAGKMAACLWQGELLKKDWVDREGAVSEKRGDSLLAINKLTEEPPPPLPLSAPPSSPILSRLVYHRMSWEIEDVLEE